MASNIRPGPEICDGESSISEVSTSIASCRMEQSQACHIGRSKASVRAKFCHTKRRTRRTMVTVFDASSDHCHLNVVDRGQRIEQAVPLLTALPPNPELAGRRPEIQRGRLEAVNVHRIALNSKVAILLWQPTREPGPRAPAILATPYCGRVAWTSARRRIKGHDVHGVGVVRVDEDGKSEVRGQSLGDGSPGMPIVVAAKHSDTRPRPAWPGPFRPPAVVLHV